MTTDHLHPTDHLHREFSQPSFSMMLEPPQVRKMCLQMGETRVTFHPDGRVEHSGTVDEAARVFFAYLEATFPDWLRARCAEQISALEAELVALRRVVDSLRRTAP